MFTTKTKQNQYNTHHVQTKHWLRAPRNPIGYSLSRAKFRECLVSASICSEIFCRLQKSASRSYTAVSRASKFPAPTKP